MIPVVMKPFGCNLANIKVADEITNATTTTKTNKITVFVFKENEEVEL